MIVNLLDSILKRIEESLWTFPSAFLNDTTLLSWKWILLNLILAVVFSVVLSRSIQRPLKKLKAHLSSKRMQTELWLDIQFFLFKILHQPLKIALAGPVIVFIALGTRDFTGSVLQGYVSAPLFHIGGVGGAFFKAFFVIVMADFSDFIFHYWSHKSKVLWPLHSVHHRSTYLTPLLKYRIHPLLQVFSNFADATVKGVALGIFGVLVYSEGLVNYDVYLLGIFFVGQFVLGHVRHSHLWISYGPVLSYIFMSPAMHQIHHSKDPKHIGKNLGVMFSIWDYAFGTLYIPKKREHLSFGASAEPRKEKKTLTGELVTPLVLSYCALKESLTSLWPQPRRDGLRASRSSLSVVIALILGLAVPVPAQGVGAEYLLQSLNEVNTIDFIPNTKAPYTLAVFIPTECKSCYSEALINVRSLLNKEASGLQVYIVTGSNVWTRGRRHLKSQNIVKPSEYIYFWHDPDARFQKNYDAKATGKFYVLFDKYGRTLAKEDLSGPVQFQDLVKLIQAKRKK